ncbi:MAG: ABC transporter permease [Anaerolineae bacterium]|nr:ABC transporter permease [Anaerolineae bacterium]
MVSRLRWNKVLRDAWQHKARSILVILAIAVGVATFGMLLTARHASIVDMYAGYWDNTPANVILYLDAFDQDLLPIVRRMPDVVDVEARHTSYARLQSGLDEWINMELTVLQDYDDSRINVVRPEAGMWPPGRRTMLLERSTFSIFDGAIGDTVTVEMPGGVQKQLPVLGTAHEFNYFSSFISRYAHGYITLDTLEWLGITPSYNQLHITLVPNPDAGGTASGGYMPDPAALERIRNEIVDHLERCGYRVNGFDDFLTRPGKHWAYDFFSALMLVLGGVGVLSLLLSGFLVINTVMALLAQETRQIGVMKAIGARRGQVMGIYLATVLLYGGLALIVAVPLGLLAGRWFADFGAMVMNYEIVSYGVIPWVLGLQAAIALGVPALSALLPVRAGTRKTVREAISDYGIGSVKSSLIDRAVARLRGLPRPLMLSLRNTFRRKTRLALTLGALSLAGAIFIGVFSTQQSMFGLLDDIMSLFSYEVEVFFQEPVRLQRIKAVAARVPGITRVESWLITDAKRVTADDSVGPTVSFYGLPVDQETVEPTMVRGRWLLPDDVNAVVISTGMLRQSPDLDLGDALVVEIDGHESTWQIVGIVLMTGNGGGNIGYTNYPALAKAARTVGYATNAVFKIQDAENPQTQKAIARALEEQYERAGMPVTTSQVIADILEANAGQFNMITTFLLVMAGLLAVVGGLGLAATMGLNVLERTREIGVLRAIGATNRALQGIIVVEGVLIGLLSWVLGSLLSYPLGNLLSGGVGMAFLGTWTDYVFSYPGVGLWLLVAVVVSAAASFWPARRAARLSVREALAYE